jgi:hypothetical protein
MEMGEESEMEMGEERRVRWRWEGRGEATSNGSTLWY